MKLRVETTSKFTLTVLRNVVESQMGLNMGYTGTVGDISDIE